MQTVKVEGKELPIRGSGETVMIFMDELHMDMFVVFRDLITDISKGTVGFNKMSLAVYALAKTANPEVARSYKEFMGNIIHVGAFVTEENMVAVINEINEVMATGEPETPSEDGKKKTPAKKKS